MVSKQVQEQVPDVPSLLTLLESLCLFFFFFLSWMKFLPARKEGGKGSEPQRRKFP